MSRAGRALDALETTLKREIAAMERGDFETLVETRQKKETQGAELESALSENPGAISRDRLFGLRQLIDRNAVGLTAAMEATGSAAKEVIEARKALTIHGKYGPTGQKRAEKTAPGSGINKVF